ncbi:MAG: alpha/beta hydrolase [Pseudomonadota bacterium]
MLRKQYVDTAAGQLHLRSHNARNEAAPVLLCLHPAPSSGLYFDTVLPLLNENRNVFAPDYPGHGGSYPLDAQPDIDDYADSMLALLDGLQVNTPVDVLGFHTGCLVGAEMALKAPARINHLVLCDVPYFDLDTQASLLTRAAQPMTLSDDIDSIAGAWKMNVPPRYTKMPDERVLAFLAEQLRCLGRDHFAFNAAFRYPCHARFSAVRTKTTVIATQSGLLDATRMAADVIPDATLREVLDITTAVFEVGATRISEEVLAALEAS